MELCQDTGRVHAAHGLDLRPGDGLLVGDECQRLQGGRRQASLAIEPEEEPDLVGEPRCGGEMDMAAMALHDPAPVVLLLQPRQGALDLLAGHLCPCRQLLDRGRLGRDKQEGFDQRAKLVVGQAGRQGFGREAHLVTRFRGLFVHVEIGWVRHVRVGCS